MFTGANIEVKVQENPKWIKESWLQRPGKADLSPLERYEINGKHPVENNLWEAEEELQRQFEGM